MRVLLVEDDDRIAEVFANRLPDMGISLLIAKSKAGAEALLCADFQLAVCDLSIPSTDGWLDAAQGNGLSVIKALCEQRPEVTVIVFSGSRAPYELLEMADDGRLRLLTKMQLPECLAEIQQVALRA